MKKITLLLSALAFGLAAQAQVSLSGTSYTQNFDALGLGFGVGLPDGWSVRTAATPSSLGTDVSATKFTGLPSSTTVWNNTTGGFKNVASADPFANYASGTATLQGTATDRTLAVRQVGNTNANFPGSDSGAAFVLNIANTTGLSAFNMTFKLQSLDSTSRRRTTWRVEYGLGANPTSFTQATTTGSMVTGSYSYSNNTVTASFGAGLDNQTGPVWIRIVTLTPTDTLNLAGTAPSASGTGNRPTSGIDDVNLTWTGAGAPNYRPVATAFTPTNGATGVALGTNLTITFDRNITAGAGSIRVTNQTDHTAPQVIPASSATIAGKVATIPGVTLLNSKTYYVMFDSTAFDTATYHSVGLYDSTSWKFSTANAPVGTVTSLSESFDASCPTGLPAGWQAISVAGPIATWKCNTTGPNYNLTINGGSVGSSEGNEDWLITPKLAATAGMQLYFKSRYNFAGPNMEVLYSANYSGTGAPSAANWTSLVSPYAAADSNKWVTKSAPLAAGNIYIAFKYISNANTTVSEGRRWDVDSVFTNTTTGINTVNSKNNTLGVQVLGTATNGHVMIGFELEGNATVKAAIYDLAGREVFAGSYNAVKGSNTLNLQPQTLQAGMYIIRISNGKDQGIARTFIQ